MASHRRRSDLVKMVVVVVLLIFDFSTWREHLHLVLSVNHLTDRINVLRQMHSYSQEVCEQITEVKSSAADVLGNLELSKRVKRHAVTNKTVVDELTFIIMGRTLQCVNDRLSWIEQNYKHAKVLVTTHVYSTLDDEAQIPAKPLYLLSKFGNKSDALNKAIAIVETKYFIIVDDSVDLVKMKSNFVDILLTNMPGFDILSGAQITGPKREFTIPCYRLRLHNWVLYESYEHRTQGNILRCSGTSLLFLARTDTFKYAARDSLFDISLPAKWLQDFFLRHDNVVKVGVLPEVIVHRTLPDSKCSFRSPDFSQPVSSQQIVDNLLPFANKHQIFNLNDEIGSHDICENSLGFVCSEKNVNKKWNIGMFSSTGLTTYPFILKSLQEALHFGAKTLKESNLVYVVEGGTLLGLIKVQNILPWDHGDVDTFVYSTRRHIINIVMKAHKQHGYSYLIRHSGFHTYVSSDPISLNGCIVYLSRRVKPEGIIYMKFQGKMLPIKRRVFTLVRKLYGATYFENRMKYTNERNYCKKPRHHGCMPDCRWHGCGAGPDSYPGIL